MSEQNKNLDSDDDNDPELEEMIDKDKHLLSNAENKALLNIREQQLREVKDKLYSQLKTTKILPLPFATEEDVLANRYVIDCNSYLDEFSHGEVKAYAVTDKEVPENNLFAVICHPHYPYRKTLMEKIYKAKYEHMIRLEEFGKVNLSITGNYHFVMVFTKPRGKKLSEILQKSRNLSEEVIIEQIMKPILTAIMELAKVGFCHGRINPDNIYIGNYGCVIGECLSEPCGMSQDFICETPERITCAPYARGNSTVKVDAYALAVVIIECLYGLQKIRQLSEVMFVKLIMESVPYHLFGMGRKIPANIADFIVGSLTPQASDRWGVKYINDWLEGKRYNLIQMTSAKDASRPFEFERNDFYNCPSLANAYKNKWNVAKDTIRHNGLTRWLELSMHKKDISEQYKRAIKITGGTDYKANKYNDELLSRVILILDPFGPLRFHETSFHINGLGCAISHALLNNEQNELNEISSIISFDLPTFQSDINDVIHAETIDMLWRLGKIRNNLLRTNIGFGIERYLYDLNPEIPCMSDRVKGMYPTSLAELLFSLNQTALTVNEDDSLLDRHVAAYCASHLSMSQDIKFANMTSFPNIANNEELLTIKLLSLAQEKAKIHELPALARWAAIRVINYTTEIHRLKIRTILSKSIINAADNGNIGQVLEAITNKNVLQKDINGLKHAKSLFQSNRNKIHQMRDDSVLKEKSIDIGMRLAILSSLLFFLFKIYFTIKEYF